jgi:FkbM family methyltransferase
MHRRKFVVRILAKIANKLIMYYENNSYDPQRNGEEFVLKALPFTGNVTIFDVGANHGKWSLLANRIFPCAEIHSFEVVPTTFKDLLKNVKNYPNIFPNDFGLSNEEGSVNIKYFPEASSISSIVINNFEKHKFKIIKGFVRSGDSYVKEKNIEKINFIKIDVEGSEHLVLEGLIDTIINGKVETIQFEYSTFNILTKFLLHDFYLFFESYNFKIGKIFPNYVDFREYKLSDENFIGSNYLAIHKSRMDLINSLS